MEKLLMESPDETSDNNNNITTDVHHIHTENQTNENEKQVVPSDSCSIRKPPLSADVNGSHSIIGRMPNFFHIQI